MNPNCVAWQFKREKRSQEPYMQKAKVSHDPKHFYEDNMERLKANGS